MSDQNIVIGIDLGTTTSCGFIPYQGDLDNITRQDNRLTMDSAVLVRNDDIAVVRMSGNAGNTGRGYVYEAKRLIGRKYKDVEEEVKRNKWPFEVFEGKDGYAAIRVSYDKEQKELTPEFVASRILYDIRKKAEGRLNHSIDSCVIGVPSEFTDEQRKKTVEAAILAGFNEKKIDLCVESTLAAMAYSAEYNLEDGLYLVYDYGGGTFDASLVRRDNGSFETIGTKGDHNRGGKDIDVTLMNYVERLLKCMGNSVDEKRRARMKYACKEMKEAFLTTSFFDLDCDFVKGDDDDYCPTLHITNATVNTTAKPAIDHTLGVVDELMREENVTEKNISYVFMVGGSSKLRGVRSALENKFGKEKIKCDTSCLCECAVAKGALLKKLNKFKDVIATPSKPLTDSMPLSVYIKSGGKEEEFIPKGSSMDFQFRKYMFPSACTDNAVFELVRKDHEKETSMGYVSIPIDKKKSNLAQPLLVSAEVHDSQKITLRVKKVLENIEYKYEVDLLMTEEERKKAIEESIVIQKEAEQKREVDEKKNGISGRCDGIMVQDNVSNELFNDLHAIKRKCNECNTIEALNQLEERLDEVLRKYNLQNS